MKTSINTGGEFYLADFGYLSMSVYSFLNYLISFLYSSFNDFHFSSTISIMELEQSTASFASFRV